MAGLSGDGNGIRNSEGTSNNYKPSLKRPPVSAPKSITQTNQTGTTAAAVVSLPATVVHHSTTVLRPTSSSLLDSSSDSETEPGHNLTRYSNGTRSEDGPIKNSLKRPRVSTPTSNTLIRPTGTAAVVSRLASTDSTSSDSYSDSESESGVNLTVDSNGACGDSKHQSRTGPLSATLTDLDVLDCPICSEPLCSPVYQVVLEKVLESVTVPCLNKLYGCTETLNYNQKVDDHLKTCKHAPCSCPYITCKYIGMSKSVYAHFARLHSRCSKQFVLGTVISISLDNYQNHVFLQERIHNTCFILNRTINKSLGSLVNVVCIAPISANGSFLYDLKAKINEDTSMKIETSVECITKWTPGACSRKCLLIPIDLIGIMAQLKLELIIRENHGFVS
ncbi:hypothetical protein OROHE_017287 [Orobanche hederae]